LSDSSVPLVSIGLPVCNEAAHVDAALRSLREIAYPRLEIIISDNASTDDTVTICRRHAAEDPRIRLETFATNQGAVANFRHVVDLANGELFMWASGHDLWSPDLVGECVDLLSRHPEATLAYASAEWIDGDGRPLSRQSGWADTRGQAPAARLFTVLWGNMHPALGVIRLPRLRACGPLPAMVGGDLVLLSALALAGDFLHVRQASWYRRELRHEANYSQKVARYTSSGFGVTRSRFSRMFPLLSLPFALTQLVLTAPQLRMLDRLLALAVLVPSLVLRFRVGTRQHGK
jgi:glycosyltransferase involved in cell wall biosynthesis